MCGFSLPGNSPVLCGNQTGILQSIAILTLTTWSEYRPEIKGSVPQDSPYPHLNASQLVCPQVTHTSVWLGYKSQVPMTSFFSGSKISINKWLSELRGMFYLILPVFYKGYKWTSKWRNIEGKVWKCPEYRSFFWPQGFCSIPPSWHMDAVSNPEALWISVFCFCCAMQFVGS